MTIAKGRDFYMKLKPREFYYTTTSGKRSKVHISRGRPKLQGRTTMLWTLCGVWLTPLVEVTEYPHTIIRIHREFCKNCLRVERRQDEH